VVPVARPQPTTASTVRTLPFSDGFAALVAWSKAPNSGSRYDAADGQFRMTRYAGAAQGVNSAAPVSDAAGSVRVSVDATELTNVGATYGVFCRGGPGGAPRPVYSGRIDRAGEWMIGSSTPTRRVLPESSPSG